MRERGNERGEKEWQGLSKWAWWVSTHMLGICMGFVACASNIRWLWFRYDSSAKVEGLEYKFCLLMSLFKFLHGINYLNLLFSSLKLSAVPHACNSSPWKAGAQSQPNLHGAPYLEQMKQWIWTADLKEYFEVILMALEWRDYLASLCPRILGYREEHSCE